MHRGTWHNLLRDSCTTQHVAFLQHSRAQPCPLQVGSLGGVWHPAAHPSAWDVPSSSQAPSCIWCLPPPPPRREGSAPHSPMGPATTTLPCPWTLPGAPLPPSDGGGSTSLSVLTATSPLCPARREGGELSLVAGWSHSTGHPAMPGTQGCHNHPNNGVLGTGIRVTGTILPHPYSPGPIGAGEGDTSGQSRCSSCAPHKQHVGEAATCAQLCKPPCTLPVTRNMLGSCNVPSTTVVPTRPPPHLPWGEGSWVSPLAPRSPAPAPSPHITCPDHHCVILPLQLVCSPGVGQPLSQPPRGQMPAPQPAGRAARAQPCPEPSCHRPAVPGHGCPALSGLDFAFTAELFPGLPGTGVGGGTGQRTPWHRAERCVPGLAGRLGRTGHTPSTAPTVAACNTALTLAQLCQGLAGGAKTSTSAEKVTGSDPVGAWCDARCSPACTPGRCWAGRWGPESPPSPCSAPGRMQGHRATVMGQQPLQDTGAWPLH